MKKPILVSVNFSNLFLNALTQVASTAPWSSKFHLVIALFEKSVRPTTVPRAPEFN